jgi:hypothetical protein
VQDSALLGHQDDCRLREVAARLRAIQEACRLWPPARVIDVERLAGWAGAHLGVVAEYGCDCGQVQRRR